MNDPDDDYLPSAQMAFRNYGASASQRSQNQGPSTSQRPQNHGASTSQRSINNGASTSQRSQNHGASSQMPQNHGASTSQGSKEAQLASLTQGMHFLMERIDEFRKDGLGQVKIKEDKKTKPKPKEEHRCKLCNKVLANSTNLFRHYRGIHAEFHPERLGYTVNDTVLSVEDTSFQEFRCSICGYISGDKNALETHTLIVHSKDIKDLCKVCGYKASSKDDLNNHSQIHANNNVSVSTTSTNVVTSNSTVTESLKAKMHKCDDCSCYFDDKSIFDEHMKLQHGFEVLCKVCNKNFRFKDFEGHVRDTHPDVYSKKDETVKKKGNMIVENVVRTKTGRMEIVFKCTKCTAKFYDKRHARRHARIHKKEFSTKAVVNNVVATENTNSEELPTENDIMYICEACDVATASYDVTVEHSQKHLTNTEFQPKTCDICDLKFEPICYEKHIDMHYSNKAINKESFRYLKYKYQLLLTNDWLAFFNMADEEVKKIVAQSIYAYTRSVKMRVVSVCGTTSYKVNLYHCSQCDHFVEPSVVTNHAVNFDTCVQIKNSFACSVCRRGFNTPIARDNHETAHNGNESFRIVMFNNEKDKEFNELLNDPNKAPGNLNRQESASAKSNNNPNKLKDNDNTIEKVIYKCLCGLCFVYKESANDHTKVCPGNEPKQSCQKCNHLFNLHELVTHCFEHHINENTRLIVENIIPDVIVVESDDECKNDKHVDEIIALSSDDEDEQDKNDKATDLLNTAGRSDVSESDKENKPQNGGIVNTTQANVCIAEQNNVQTKDPGDVSATTTRNDVSMDEDGRDESCNDSESINDPGDSNHGITDDDDSQDTITSGEYAEALKNTTNLNALDVAAKRNNEIKCVETNRLINPFHVRNTLYSNMRDAGEINKKKWQQR